MQQLKRPTNGSGALSPSTVIAGVAGFLGATGILAAIGFLVQHALFLMIGLPYPPFSTIDYLRFAGVFLFDVFIVVILIKGVTWAVVPALVVVVGIAIFVWLRLPAPRTRQEFTMCYTRLWGKLVRWYEWAFQGRLALGFCLIGLVVFTFYYHYPVFAQRYIMATLDPCGDPSMAPMSFRPVVRVWRWIDCRRYNIREAVLDQDRLAEIQSIYSIGVLLLLVLTVYVAYHPYNQFTASGRRLSRGRRWMWSVTGVLLCFSFVYLPGGYAVLFRDKQAPMVHVAFKTMDAPAKPGGMGGGRQAPGEKRTSAKPVLPAANVSTWQDGIMDKSWYLLFQNDKEVWLFRWPTALILQKDQLGMIDIGRRQWIFPAH